MTVQAEPESPRIAQLEHQLRNGNSAALEVFWSRLHEDGAPIVEPISGDNGHSLLTFVWQRKADVSAAAVHGPGLPGFFQMLHELMGSDAFYRTYRVRKDFRTSYRLALNPPSITLPPDSEEKANEIQAYMLNPDVLIPDPLNANRRHIGNHLDPARPSDPPREVFSSVVELADAPPQPYVARRPGVPHGWVHSHRFASAILGNERNIYLYTPPGYAESDAEYSLLITFDGLAYVRLVPTNNIVDNLLAEGRIPPLIVAALDNPDQATRSRELPCYEPFSEFLATEFLPWLHANYRVTSDPSRVVVAGSSHGGLAASFVALRYPELFGNVLSQSGSYYWGPGIDFSKALPEANGAFQWLPGQYAAAEKLPLRFYVEVGLLESALITQPERPKESDQLLGNRRMRDVLAEKGYEVHYSEFNGGHDYACWRGSFADGLIALLGSG